MLPVTILILTRDEALHISRAIASVSRHVARVVVVDSGSTDDTVHLARAAGAEVFHNGWVNHAVQVNWAIDNCRIDTPWVFRLDADEIVQPDLWDALDPLIGGPAAGLTVNRRIHFLGRWIRHGGLYPTRILRLWRTGRARCEDRWVDEHMLVDGPVAHLDADVVDINLNSVGWWTDKHNAYATRTAYEALRRADDPGAAAMGGQARAKRWLVRNVYRRLPLGLGPFAYFLWRYLARFGFLDGWPGLAFHVLQGFWYRFLVDVKTWEIRRVMRDDGVDLAEAVRRRYGLKV
jgi:glycosyltransferase involved in cell wall biosynthesis